MSKFSYEVFIRPGNYFTKRELESLTDELRNVATNCFSEIPYYQVLTGKRDEYRRAIISVARNKKGKIVAFCSSLGLDVPNCGEVLHLGLTCVDPEARGKNLTSKLLQKLLIQYLLKEAPIEGAWITNCACVLSSLGSVSLYFEDVYPSPYGLNEPSGMHINIAKGISELHRSPIAINYDAKFNEETFVFEGSVKDAVFEKSANDTRYHHRNINITNFYQEILNFDRGDEVLQIGRVSLLSYPKYLVKSASRKLKQSLKNLDQQSDEYAIERS